MVFNETFWSAVKRRDMKNMLEYLFEQSGEDEALEVIKTTSRITEAAINRMKDALGTETNANEDDTDDTELDYQEPINEEAAKNNELIELEKKVQKAIKSNDYKKAKKALKKLVATGLGGAEIETLKKQIKDMK